MDTLAEPFSSRPFLPDCSPSRSFLSSAAPTRPSQPFLHATHQFPATPPTFSSVPPPLPLLRSILHRLHSVPSSTLTRNRAGGPAAPRSPRAAPAARPAVPAPALPRLSLIFPSSGARLPAPRPLPAEPPPFLTPPSAGLWADHSSTAARGPIPRKDEAAPSAPHPQAHYRPRRSCLLPRWSPPPPPPPPP